MSCRRRAARVSRPKLNPGDGFITRTRGDSPASTTELKGQPGADCSMLGGIASLLERGNAPTRVERPAGGGGTNQRARNKWTVVWSRLTVQSRPGSARCRRRARQGRAAGKRRNAPRPPTVDGYRPPGRCPGLSLTRLRPCQLACAGLKAVSGLLFNRLAQEVQCSLRSIAAENSFCPPLCPAPNASLHRGGLLICRWGMISVCRRMPEDGTNTATELRSSFRMRECRLVVMARNQDEDELDVTASESRSHMPFWGLHGQDTNSP